MDDEKRVIDGYEVTQSVKIYGMEIVIAENPDAEEPYMMWRRSLGESFGAETHLIPVFDSDYLKIFREFIQCQSVYADSLDLERVYRGSPLAGDAALTADDCVAGGMSGDLKGKVVAVKASALSPEYRACSHQLALVEGGFGCSPNARGQAVFGVNLYSRGPERWARSDILGVIDENKLPNWAREKLAALQKPAEKESVMEKLRQGKQPAVRERPKQKTRDKTGPEL